MKNATHARAIETLKETENAKTYAWARCLVNAAIEVLDCSDASLDAIRSLSRALRYGEDMRSSMDLCINDAIEILAKASGVFVGRRSMGGRVTTL